MTTILRVRSLEFRSIFLRRMLKGIFLIALFHLNELLVLCQVLKCSMGTKLGDTHISLYVCQGNMILCLKVPLHYETQLNC